MAAIGNIVLPEYPLLLAPMEDVTDVSFRRLCKAYGTDLLFTEFVASEALIRYVDESIKKMQVSEPERPIGIQLFGYDLDSMKRAATIAEEAQPDFIDLNYGCPVKKITTKGGGAAMMKDPDKMQRMTEAVVRSTRLPVTVKTRLGWDEDHKNILEITRRLQDTGIEAITVHGRTRSQFYSGEADWTWIAKVKNHPDIVLPVFGNGDINDPASAKYVFHHYGVDGIMIGRGAIGRPWLFAQIKNYLQNGSILPEPSIPEKVDVVKKHLDMAIENKGVTKGIFELRIHLAGYFKNLPHFKEYRKQLMQLKDPDRIHQLLNTIKTVYYNY